MTETDLPAPRPKAPRYRFGRTREPGHDRWGYPPPQRGWARGTIQNLERAHQRTPFGIRITCDFDIYPDDDAAPALPVRMVGYTFSQELRPGLVVEVEIGDDMSGRERHVTDLLRMPFDHHNIIRAFRPVEELTRGTVARRDRWRTMLFIAGPVAAGLAVIWAVWRYTGIVE